MESMFLNIFSINNNKVTPIKSTQPQEQFEVRKRESLIKSVRKSFLWVKLTQIVWYLILKDCVS